VILVAVVAAGVTEFPEELENCREVGLGRYKLKVLRLERIVAGKRAANRPKDRLVLPVLEDSLAASAVAARRTKRHAPRRT
jgi:hypothetical protein